MSNATTQDVDLDDGTLQLRTALQLAENTVRAIRFAIDSRLAEKNRKPFFTPDESKDPLDYREARAPDGRFSDLGRKVAKDFLIAGFSDAAVGSFMSVSPFGIGQFRRRLGILPGQRQRR